MNSILNTIKKMLGVDASDEYFDVDIITNINTTFTILTQLGVGPEKGYRIEDASNEWSEFLPVGEQLEMVKTYIYLKLRILFDPPSSSFVLDSITKQSQEMEWRLNVLVDKGEITNE